jgi:hypothetical protein
MGSYSNGSINLLTLHPKEYADFMEKYYAGDKTLPIPIFNGGLENYAGEFELYKRRKTLKYKITNFLKRVINAKKQKG